MFIGKGGQIEKGASGLKGKTLGYLKGTKKFTKYETNAEQFNQEPENKHNQNGFVPKKDYIVSHYKSGEETKQFSEFDDLKEAKKFAGKNNGILNHKDDFKTNADRDKLNKPSQKVESIEQGDPGHKFSGYDNVAKKYGISVNENGEISTEKGNTGIKIKEVKGRVRIESKSGDLYYSGKGNEAVGKFIESFWVRKQKPIDN